jgi:D-serine deaminase-like pyridoxal phosphate-dependent protein
MSRATMNVDVDIRGNQRRIGVTEGRIDALMLSRSKALDAAHAAAVKSYQGILHHPACINQSPRRDCTAHPCSLFLFSEWADALVDQVGTPIPPDVKE